MLPCEASIPSIIFHVGLPRDPLPHLHRHQNYLCQKKFKAHREWHLNPNLRRRTRALQPTFRTFIFLKARIQAIRSAPGNKLLHDLNSDAECEEEFIENEALRDILAEVYNMIVKVVESSFTVPLHSEFFYAFVNIRPVLQEIDEEILPVTAVDVNVAP